MEPLKGQARGLHQNRELNIAVSRICGAGHRFGVQVIDGQVSDGAPLASICEQPELWDNFPCASICPGCRGARRRHHPAARPGPVDRRPTSTRWWSGPRARRAGGPGGADVEAGQLRGGPLGVGWPLGRQVEQGAACRRCHGAGPIGLAGGRGAAYVGLRLDRTPALGWGGSGTTKVVWVCHPSNSAKLRRNAAVERWRRLAFRWPAAPGPRAPCCRLPPSLH